MKQLFLSNIALLVLINLLIKPLYIFGIDRSVQNQVGAEIYGLYFALYNFAFLFQMVNDFGIQNFNNRNIARHPHLLDKYFPDFLILKALLSLVYLALLLTGAWLVGYTEEQMPLLFWIGVNWSMSALLLYLRSNVSGLGLYRADSLLSVLDRSLLILGLGPLLWVPAWRTAFRIEWFVYAQTITLGLASTIAFLIAWKKVQTWRFRLDRKRMAVILRQSFPFALTVLLMTVYTRIDGVMIERMLEDGAFEAGVYASAYRLLDAANMIGFLFAGLLLPMFSRMLKNKEPVGALVGLGFQWLFAGAVTLAIATIFFRVQIMQTLYAGGGGADILAWLMAAFVAMAGTYVYGALLTAHGEMYWLNLIFTGGIAVNILLNAMLIPRLGALGAAMATAATQWAALLAQILLAQVALNLKTDMRAIFRNAAFAACLTAGCSFLYHWNGPGWVVKFLLCAPAGLLTAFIFGLIRIRDIQQLLNANRDG